MELTPHIVGIGGTTRPGSSTEKALRVALRACQESGASVTAFTGEELAQLPLYAPELPDRTPLAVRLVEVLRRADGVIVASPGYHGSVSGLVKNALDYVEDMREDDPQCYFSGRAVGCIATGAGWQGVVTTLEAMRSIVHALRGWPTPMGAAINSTLPVFGPDGDIVDERTRFQLTTVAQEVMQFARWKLAALEHVSER
jgi:FMN reductase